MEKNSIVGSVIYDSKRFLYNAIVLRVDETGAVIREEVTAAPEEKADAMRRVLRLKQLKRDCGGSFDNIIRVFLEKVNIPLTATLQDREDSAWSKCQFPWVANGKDRWMLQHYGLAVTDSEAVTGEDLLLAELKRLQAMHYEKSREIVTAIRQGDPAKMREVINGVLESVALFPFATQGV